MNVHSETWGNTSDGRAIKLYTLTNDNGMTVRLSSLGAAIIEVHVPDRDGNSENVNLRAPNLEDYVDNPSGFGVVVGRYANRIGNGRFMLDGKTYELAVNNGPNHLHGGLRGFQHKAWTPIVIDGLQLPGQDQTELVGVGFHYESADGEEGYPGKVSVLVSYTLHRDNRLTLSYQAETDAPTVINLTNHAYWNLGGAGSGDVLGHELTIMASRYLDFDQNVLPTGDILPVGNTPFDFSLPTPIGENIDQAGGYDLCYAIDDWDGTLRHAATARDPKSGRVMEVHTTEPGVQLYTAEHFDESAGSAGYAARHAFCLECQHYPDSPHHEDFPSTVLRPGEQYTQITEHRFRVD